MRHIELWKLAFQNVLASALRSALTVLELSIGVAAVLAVITLGEAGRAQVRNEIGKMGIDKVLVTSEAGPALTGEDAQLIGSRLSTQVDELLCLPAHVSTDIGSADTLLVGIGAAYLKGTYPVLRTGRLWSEGEWNATVPAAVVGRDLAHDIRLSAGQWFTAGGQMLQCIGILEELPVAAQIDFRSCVLLPEGFLTPWSSMALRQLSVHVPVGVTQDETAETVKQLMDASGKTVAAVSMQLQAEAADTVVLIFMDVLRWVALICMLVGGVGVMNILLVSVRERRREIGIMQSLGAGRQLICSLFLYEGIAYALTGGILGLLLGGCIIGIAGASIGLSPVVQPADCAFVFASSVLVGLLSGVVPAFRASMLRPIDALREE